MACAIGRKTICQPRFQQRLHQSTSSPYMKKLSSSNPTSLIPALRNIQKQPTKTSTAAVRSWGKNSMCSPLKNREPLNAVARPVAEQKLFHSVGKRRHELCSVIPELRMRGPTFPTDGF